MVHLLLTDASGDLTEGEFPGGRPVIHHGRGFQVMTDSPTFAGQHRRNTCGSRLDGTRVLPGRHQLRGLSRGSR